MSENQNIEWKENWRDEYLKWICGFANAAGGKIYIGTDDNGRVVGVADAKKLLEDIPNKVRDVLGIMVDVNLLEENGLQYIEIDVPSYSNPINYKGQYHYRSGSTKQELKGAALNRFIMQKTGRHWDEFPIERAKAEDLSESALNRFRKEAARSGRVDEGVLNDTTGHLLQDLRLIDDTGHLNRAAVLLFHPDPERYVFGAYIKIGFFRDDKGNLEFQDDSRCFDGTGGQGYGLDKDQVFNLPDFIRGHFPAGNAAVPGGSHPGITDERHCPQGLRQRCTHPNQRISRPHYFLELRAVAGGLDYRQAV